MCIICVELIKQRMTVFEAERNSGEMVNTAKPGEDVEHYRQLNEAIQDGDFDKLGEIIDEGTDEETI